MSIVRTRIASAVLLVCVPVFCGRPEATKPQASGPDVVLFVIDTLRADHLSSHGYFRGTSPNLDRFAGTGVRCANASAQSSWTAPSMVSMFTSRFVASDFKKMPKSQSVRTLAERLKDAGYKTLGFQFNVLLGLGSGFERGFDEYKVEPSLKEFVDSVSDPDRTPRFLYVHFVEPHDPYEPAPQFDVFPPAPLLPKRVDRIRDALSEANPTSSSAEISRQAREAATEIAAEIAKYDGEIRAIDSKFGEFLELLDRRGSRKNTLVIVASDHGECLWEHRETPSALAVTSETPVRKLFKQTHNTLLNESLLHVPLIFAGPNVPVGAVHPALVANVDIVPTILDLLGLARDEDIDGRSLLPDFVDLSAGKTPRGREISFANTSIFTSARNHLGGKRIEPWDPSGPDRAIFYDLNTDPEEQNPRYDLESSKDLAARIAEIRRIGLIADQGESLMDPETEARMRQLGYLGGPGPKR